MIEVSIMGLFNRETCRSFVIGFALGAVAVCALLGTGVLDGGGMVPSAFAAPTH